MRFLGKHQDMPFLMVQAGKHLFKTEESDRGSRPHRLLPAVPLSKMEESFESDNSDSSLSTLATFTTATDGDSMVVQSIERGQKQLKNTNLDLIPAKRSSSGRSIRCPTSPTTVSVGRASSGLTKSGNETPYTQTSRLTSPTIPRQLARGAVPLPLAATQPALIPRAFTLTVHLSKESFAMSCGNKTKHAPQDVKIDVFFNGEMTASTYIPARYRGEANNMIQLTQRFSGRRVDRMAECPWVIVPPGQNADGSLRTSKRNKGAYVGAQERWHLIGKALEEEGEQFGRSRYGDQSVVGEYLTSLSKLEMPAEVDDMQKGGGPKFGVIDVVLTLGKGQKDEPEKGYLKEPTRLRLRGFDVKQSEEANEKLIEESGIDPDKIHVEARSLNLSATVSTRFTTPHAPSAAPSGVRRRQSIALADRNPTSSLPAKAKGTTKMPGVCDESVTAMQVDGITSPDAGSRAVDVSLVPAGTPVLKVIGQRRYDLPSRLANSSSSGVSAPAASRALVANMSRSRKFKAAMGLEVGNTIPSQQKELRPRQSHTPDISESGFISDSSLISSAYSPPSTISRPYRGADPQRTEEASVSRRSRYGGLHSVSNYLELSRDVKTATDGIRSTSDRSRRQENLGTSIPSVLPSTPNVPQTGYKHSILTIAEYSKPQRRQYPSGWAVSDKPTLAEEMAQIEASSRKEIIMRTAKVENKASTTPSDGKQTSPRRILKLKVKEPVAAQKTYSATPTHAAELAPQTSSTYTISRRPRPVSHRTAKSYASTKRTSKPAPSPSPSPMPSAPRGRRSTASTSLAPNPLPVFPTPALSQDSVLSYAEGTAWKAGLGLVNGAAGVERGVYRQVRAERNGWFEESGVLMGVRFLVG